jgi:osmoprotectant transport system permease protein
MTFGGSLVIAAVALLSDLLLGQLEKYIKRRRKM